MSTISPIDLRDGKLRKIYLKCTYGLGVGTELPLRDIRCYLRKRKSECEGKIAICKASCHYVISCPP